MIRLIKSSAYIRKPWKNGGGMLADIVMFPAGAGLDVFDWRISLAHVGMSGPFSNFPGIDRGMIILSGDGMRLDIAGAASVVLGAASPPFAFPGDTPAAATLTAGPIDDLNAMTRRDRYSHTMTRHVLTGVQHFAPPPRGTLVVYVERGSLTAAGVGAETSAETGDTLVIDQPTAVTATVPTSLCAINIQPRSNER
jgi:uncharacterized protein